MTLETMVQWTDIINSISSPLAGIFAFLLLITIIKKKAQPEARKLLLTVFAPIAIGFMLYGIAQLLYTTFSIKNVEGLLPITDAIWIIGYIPVFFGFTYFSISIYMKHGRTEKE